MLDSLLLISQYWRLQKSISFNLKRQYPGAEALYVNRSPYATIEGQMATSCDLSVFSNRWSKLWQCLYTTLRVGNNKWALVYKVVRLSSDLGMIPAPGLSPVQIKKKGTCTGNGKPILISPIQNSQLLSPRNYFNSYNRINFKLILLTLLFKSLCFMRKLNCFLVLDIISIVMHWGFCKYVLSKKIKRDIVNKSAFRDRKLIVIV